MDNGVRCIYDDFMTSLQGGDTVTVSLKGVDEITYTTREIYEAIDFRVNRHSPKPIPLTLNQLREMIGQPVYAQSVLSSELGQWCVIDRIHGRGDGVHIVAVYGVHMTLEASDYGKTWLAYTTRPETEGD